MSSLSRQLGAAARLDLAEVLRSRWIWFCVGVYVLLGAVMVVVGARESAVLGFTGTGRVLVSFSHALVLLLPLIALVATAPTIQRAREDGSLELLLTQPLSPGAWFTATLAVRYLALVVPLALVVVGIGVWGHVAYAHPIPWGFIGTSIAISASLLLAFTGIGALISVVARNPARVITYLVLAWALGVALLDFGLIGLMLRWRVDARAVFILAAVNPVEAARLGLLSGLDPELSSFGPVGFYLATAVGPRALLGLAVAWPAVVGVATALVAFLRFRSTDRT